MMFSEGDQVSSFTNVYNDINIIGIHVTDISMLTAKLKGVIIKLQLLLYSP